MSITPDDRRDPADRPAAEPEPDPGAAPDPGSAPAPAGTDGLAAASYRPPPSPAYAPKPTSVVDPRPRGPAPGDGDGEGVRAREGDGRDEGDGTNRPGGRAGEGAGADGDDAGAATGADEPAATTRLGWQLLIAGLVLVLVAGAVAVVAVTSGADTGTYAFGEVRAVTGDVVVRTAGDASPRVLEEGETVTAGWVIDTPADAAATLDLAGGGVARVDGGTRLRFVDLAVDPDTGDRARDSEPAIEVSGGRLWLVPGEPDDATSPVKASTSDATVISTGNPMAIDCTAPCTVEAPAGGVTLTTDAGVDVAPTTDEVVTVSGPTTLELTLGDGVSAWARQNLDADARDGLPEPDDDGGAGVVGSAILDGRYSVAVTVTGPPSGDPIPRALRYPEGETYAVDLSAEGGDCEPSSCSVAVASDDGAAGTARVGDGEVALTFSLPIDCYDASHTRVVRPGIGTTAVEATASIEAVEFDGARWLIRRLRGSGTVAATVDAACDPRDVLGTSTSPISVAAG